MRRFALSCSSREAESDWLISALWILVTRRLVERLFASPNAIPSRRATRSIRIKLLASEQNALCVSAAFAVRFPELLYGRCELLHARKSLA